MDVSSHPGDADRAKQPLSIVVGFDLSSQAELALEEAVALAATSGPTVLHVIGVLDGAGPALNDTQESLSDEVTSRQQAIAAATEEMLARRGRPGTRVFVHIRIGRAAHEILTLARDVVAGLIIVGTHGRHGLQRLLIGSVAEQVMREAHCPVLIMRPSSYHHIDNVEVGPDAACPACVVRRAETGGAEWWCSAHGKTWVQPHRYAYTDSGINRLRPDEWALW